MLRKQTRPNTRASDMCFAFDSPFFLRTCTLMTHNKVILGLSVLCVGLYEASWWRDVSGDGWV